MANRRRMILAGATALTVTLIGQLLVTNTAEAGPDTNPAGSAALANEITNKFAAYGNSGSTNHWTGGDGLEAIELPGGRVIWFFNDYWYGVGTPTGTRGSYDAVMPRNGIVIQNADGTMGATVAGAGGSTLVNTTLGGWLWGGGQRLEGATIQKFYMRMGNTSGSVFPTALGAELRTIPTGSVQDETSYGNPTGGLPANVRDCTLTVPGHCILWGMALADYVDDGVPYTYIYASDVSAGSSSKKLRIARVPQGDLTATWRYFTGDNNSWSTDPGDAIATGTVASEALSVTKQSGRWVLVTQDTAGGLNGNVISYYADKPWGFTSDEKSTLFAMPEATVGSGTPGVGIWAYTPRLMPHLSTSGDQVVIGYSVNSLLEDSACGKLAYVDASVYRPHFRSVTLPHPAQPSGFQAPTRPDPDSRWMPTSQLPAWCSSGSAAVPSPTGVTATPNSVNSDLTFSWSQSPTATWSFGFQFRPAGGSWSAEYPLFVPNNRTWTAGLLTPGRSYEFRVRAMTWYGQPSAWTTKSATMPIDAPTGLGVARTAATKCSLTITDPQVGVYWQVQQQKVGTTTWSTPVAVGTKTPYFLVTSGVKYDFRVRAYSDYATSAWTTAKRCGL
ncbi:DUF5005 domain-containing protein [Nocardioides conyzicola]|uniref:Fibronectin type-III domain-containing protein n=1 Tax=Nocardioides conyzicola TaxID=1651781 RepID=A0ABP8X926_9ACTN